MSLRIVVADDSAILREGLAGLLERRGHSIVGQADSAPALEAVADSAGVRFLAPPLALCTDNAAMIAWAGIERFRLGHRCAPGRVGAVHHRVGEPAAPNQGAEPRHGQHDAAPRGDRLGGFTHTPERSGDVGWLEDQWPETQ